MTAENSNYLFAKMSTVLSFPLSDGTKRSDLVRSSNIKTPDGNIIKVKTKLDEIETQVEKKVREIIQVLKTNHTKFVDPDFGPSNDSPFGEKSLYGNEPPAPAGTSKYPSPESLKWERPLYASKNTADETSDQEEEEEYDEFADNDKKSNDEVWCMDGELFIDGSSSGDVVQGKLGDCWFLGALSVLGTQENLLKKCFWNSDEYQEFGLYVCVFYKDCGLRYVIIDDRIPVFASSGKVVFGQCKDPNELWVPLIEKAYAKLHGCYKALIGGYVHLGLADLTGFVPRLIGLKQGYLGYSGDFNDEELWKLLIRYRNWGCLMGTSIQSKPGEEGKVEADAGDGLKMGHAYSFLSCGTITLKNQKKVKLVRLRNPWGFGEWTGKWSDNSPEREEYKDEIFAEFSKKSNSNEIKRDENGEIIDTEDINSTSNDGTFFMTFEDWKLHFTCLFVAIQFPINYFGQTCRGFWSGDIGGPREMPTWIANPKIKLSFSDKSETNKRHVFIGLSINDTRLTLGKEYYTDPLYRVGVSFDVVTEEDINNRVRDKSLKSQTANTNYIITNSWKDLENPSPVPQPPYMFGSAQVEMLLDPSKEYYIVPSLKNRKQSGAYFIQVYSDGLFELSTGVATDLERKPKECQVGNKTVHLTESQFYEKMEEVRERIQSEAKKLNITINDLARIFKEEQNDSISRTTFKRKLIQMGFSLADFPDEDFVVLDEDNNGSISAKEFLKFFGTEYSLDLDSIKTLEPPPDDLIFQPIDIAGQLTVTVNGAKSLRKASTWFTPTVVANSNTSVTDKELLPNGPKSREKFIYLIEEAQKSRKEPINISYPTKRFRSIKNTSETKNPIINSNNSNNSNNNNNNLLLDVSTSALLPENSTFSPKTFMSVRKDQKPTLLSSSTTILKTDESLIPKLHNDPVLQKTESLRVQMLSDWRQKLKNNFKVDSQSGTQSINRNGNNGNNNNGGGSISINTINQGNSNNSILIHRHCVKKRTQEVTPTFSIYHFLGISAEEYKKLFPNTKEQLPLTSIGNNNKITVVNNQGVQSSSSSSSSSSSTSQKIQQQQQLQQQPTFLSLKRNPIKAGIFHDDNIDYDIWDLLIDRVSVISACRNRDIVHLTRLLNHSTAKQYLTPKAFDTLQITPKATSVIPTPLKTPQIELATKKGTKSIPLNNKYQSGTASVKLKSGPSKISSTIALARDILDTMTTEVQYTEVFRRLIPIPILKFSHLDESLGAEIISETNFNFGSNLKNWFEFFDRNHDGEISFEEFTIALSRLNTRLSTDDMSTLFLRFQTNKADELIDWFEFMTFFEKIIHRKYVERITLDSHDDDIDMIEVLKQFIIKCSLPLPDITALSNPSLSSNNQSTPVTSKLTKSKIDENQDNNGKKVQPIPKKILYQEILTLNQNDLGRNVELLTRAGLHITEIVMDRISRIFNYDLATFQKFYLAVTSDNNPDLLESVMNDVLIQLLSALSSRCHVTSLPPSSMALSNSVSSSKLPKTTATTTNNNSNNNSNNNNKNIDFSVFNLTSDEELGKLWLSVSPTRETPISYEQFSNYLYDVLSQHLDLEKNSVSSNVTTNTTNIPSSTPKTATKESSNNNNNNSNNNNNNNKSLLFQSIERYVLCNLISDEIVHSCWNKLSIKERVGSIDKIHPNKLSYSAFKAFFRRSHINSIEQKLQYLVHLQNCSDNGIINYLVHIFIPTLHHGPLRDESQLNHIILIAYDPLSSTIFKMKIDGDCSKMPYGTDLKSEKGIKSVLGIILERYGIKPELFERDKDKRQFYEYASRFYNPYETPYEDRMLMELCQRLRLVNTGHKTCLIIAEELKFINKLKELIQQASLPFFSIVNEVSLLFEVSIEAVNKVGSIQKLVFGSIRKNKALRYFLMNVVSDLKVLLRTYDSDIYEEMDWKEMLAYLSDHRNPFVTVQLLPQYVEPQQGMIDYIPEDMRNTKYKDIIKELNIKIVEDHIESPDEVISDNPSIPFVYKGIPDVDGGTHPAWNDTFKIPFKPPKLTNCQVLFTDIMEMYIDNIRKYIVVMVRVAKDKSLFMTAYDPRTSTEYILFGGPVDWIRPNIAEASPELLSKLLSKSSDISIKSDLSRLDIFQKQLENAIEEHNDPKSPLHKKFRLGFAITPRLMISVYNQKNESDVELLGYSQVSISSVLSGAGNRITLWARLMHEIVTPLNNSIMNSNNNGSNISIIGGNNNSLSISSSSLSLSFNGGSNNSNNNNNTQISYVNAGAIQIQLEYLKQTELESIEESKKNAKERRKKKENVIILQRRNSQFGISFNNLNNATSNNNGSNNGVVESKGDSSELLQNIQLINQEKKKMLKEIEDLNDSKKKTLDDQLKIQEQYNKIKSKYDDLMKEFTSLQTKYDEKKNLPIPPNSNSNSNNNNGGGDGVMVNGDVNTTSINRSDGSLENIIHGIIEVFINRYMKKNTQPNNPNNVISSANILRPLSKSIKGYVDQGNNGISPYSLEQLLNDLLIQISSNDTEAIVRFLDNSSSGYVTIPILMEYFKTECNKLLEKLKVKEVPLSSSRKNSGKEKTKDNLVDSKNETKKVDPVSTVVGGDQDMPNVPDSNKTPLLEPQQSQQSQSQQPVRLSTDLSANEVIDWDQYPLPDDGFWERRIDKKSGKVYYLNHMTKTTQWKHPLFKSSSKRNQNNIESNQNLNQTLPVRNSNLNSNQIENNGLNYTAPIRPPPSASSSSTNNPSGDQRQQNRARVKPAWNK